MKIWIMNHYAGDTFFDEGGRHYAFAKYMKRSGHEPVIFCANTKHGVAEHYFEIENRWQQHILEEIHTPYVFIDARTYEGNGKQRILNMIDFYRNLKKVAVQYAKENGKPDIILASSVHPLTMVAGIKIAKKFGVKCVCEVRDLWPESIVAYSNRWTKNNLLIRLLYQGEKWIYRKADSVVMTWPGGYEYIVDQGWERKIPLEKIVHISNGVDGECFQKNLECFPWADKDLQRKDKKKFVYTGAIRKVNDVRVLVDVADILKHRGNEEALLLIYGDGDEKEELEEVVKELGLENIVFKGRVPKASIPSILKQADVSILHNLSTILDKYGQSQNKFFEYLAVGHPILMTYSVGYSVINENNCGIELQEQTPEKIADAIEFFCNMESERYMVYCRNAMECAKKYDFFVLTMRLIELIKNVKKL